MKNKPIVTNENAAKYTLWLVLVAFLFRFCIAKWTGLGIGESYYFGGSRILELSYFDQPPLFMWLSGWLMRIFGETNLVLRFPALVLFSGTSWVIFLITRQFFNAASGFYAVLLLSLSGVFFLSGTWFQPDAPLMFFWICYVYCLTKIIFMTKDDLKLSGNNRKAYYWWFLSGLMLGLTILSKYHAIFLMIGLLLFVVTSKKARHWLLHPGAYLSILISLIVALPVFIWNYDHHWASFLFQGGRALDGGIFKLHIDWFLRSFLGQALWITPWVWIPLILQLVKSFKLRNIDHHYGFCFWMALTPLVFFTAVTLWADLQYHFHWQAPGYMMLYIPLGKMVQDKIMLNQKSRNTIKRWLTFTIIFTSSIFIFLSVHTQTGFWTWYGPKWMASKANPHSVAYDQTMEGYDYTDLNTAFEKNGWLNNSNIFVGTTHWWMSGKVDWALKGKKDVVCFDGDSRNYMYFFDPKKIIGKDAIIVTRGKDDTIKSNVAPFCDSLNQLPDIAITRHGVDELDLHIFECKNFHNTDKIERKDLPVYKALNNQLP